MNIHMPEKQKLLFIGIVMNGAGTEKSFISFINCIDFEKYEVDLLLAKKEGLFMPQIPKEVNVIEMPEGGELFLLDAKNAAKTLFDCFVKKNPFVLFEILPYFLKVLFSRKTAPFTVTRLWCRMMRKLPQAEKIYDAAVAFWGDRTMFYMIDKVKAKKYISWLHFDYAMPPRDDKTYLHYFEKCDRIVTVSSIVDRALKEKLAQIADKCLVIENINNPEWLRDMALSHESFPDRQFKGKRILTIGRIIEQKGLDFVPPVLERLKKEGYDIRWYVIGDGPDDYKAYIIDLAAKHNVMDSLLFLGPTINPYPYLRDCDLYVQPSRHEGKPISVEEAKIMRCPMTVSNYLSASEQMGDGKYGLVHEIGSEGLYSAVRQLLDDPALCDRFVQTLSKCDFGNKGEIEKFYRILE